MPEITGRRGPRQPVPLDATPPAPTNGHRKRTAVTDDEPAPRPAAVVDPSDHEPFDPAALAAQHAQAFTEDQARDTRIDEHLRDVQASLPPLSAAA